MKFIAKKMTEILEQYLGINESGTFDIMDYQHSGVARDAENRPDNSHYIIGFDSISSRQIGKDALEKAGYSCINFDDKYNELKVYTKFKDDISDESIKIKDCLKNVGIRG